MGTRLAEPFDVTRRLQQRTTLLLVLGAAALSAGCAQRMQVPTELADAVEHPIEGRAGDDRFLSNELALGQYRAASISRGWTTSFVARDFFGKALDEIRAYPQRDSYSFAFHGTQEEWRAVCTARPQHTALPNFTPTDTNHLGCACMTEAGGRAVHIDLASETDVLRGVMSQPSGSFSIAGTRDLAGTAARARHATGYLVSTNERLIAAIDVLNSGVLWVMPDLPSEQTDAVACAAVALLLHH